MEGVADRGGQGDVCCKVESRPTHAGNAAFTLQFDTYTRECGGESEYLSTQGIGKGEGWRLYFWLEMVGLVMDAVGGCCGRNGIDDLAFVTIFSSLVPPLCHQKGDVIRVAGSLPQNALQCGVYARLGLALNSESWEKTSAREEFLGFAVEDDDNARKGRQNY